MKTLLIGPPGCGKTTALIGKVEAALARGVNPKRIAFFSFSKEAVREARNRAMTVLNLRAADLPLFRTIHSMCFRSLGLRRSDVFGKEGIEVLAKLTGEKFSDRSATGTVTLAGRGDYALHIDQLARNTGIETKKTWEDNQKFGWWALERAIAAYGHYRNDTGLYDFTDMLEEVANHGTPLDVDVAIIDEAQDLTKLQWLVMDRLLKHCPEVWVAGDEDQTIYSWAGADVATLLNFDGRVEVLGQSYRLPPAIHALAVSVANRIRERTPKLWNAKDGEPGEIRKIFRFGVLPLKNGETWLLLARTNYRAAKLSEELRKMGLVHDLFGECSIKPKHLRAMIAWERWRSGKSVPSLSAAQVLEYIGRPVPDAVKTSDREWTADQLAVDTTEPWHNALTGIPVRDREYYRECRQNGETFLDMPEVSRIRVETMHGAKGKEADNVLLTTGLTPKIKEAMKPRGGGWDAEMRLLYVGVSRAKKRLYIMPPERGEAYHPILFMV